MASRIITIPIENKPGTLAQASSILAKENVNIQAVECEALGEFGFARFHTNDPARAEKVLKAKGFPVAVTDTVEITLPNKPGELARVCQKLADADVNILGCFGSAGGNGGEGRIVFRVDNVDEAQRVLQTETRKERPVTR